MAMPSWIVLPGSVNLKYPILDIVIGSEVDPFCIRDYTDTLSKDALNHRATGPLCYFALFSFNMFCSLG